METAIVKGHLKDLGCEAEDKDHTLAQLGQRAERRSLKLLKLEHPCKRKWLTKSERWKG